MKENTIGRNGFALAALAVISGLALLWADPFALQTVRNILFDQYQRWQPREYVSVPVKIIDIDEESLARHGQWPWPRTRIAQLVDRLKEAGAASIGFDVVFAEADRNSPASMVALWTLDGRLRAELEQLPDHDQVLSHSLQGANAVLGFTAQRDEFGAHATPGPELDGSAALQPRPFRYVNVGPPPAHWLHTFDSVLTARAILTQAASGMGALNFMTDGDGVVRRVPLVLEVAGEPMPTLVAESLRVAQGERNYFLKTEGANIGLAEIRIGALEIPTTPRGEVWVHYSRAVPGRYVPAWKVLAGQVSLDQLAGQVVLIGSSASGLMDLRLSPLGGIMPGVEAHAQALEQILSGTVLQRPGWARAAESIALALGCLVVGFVVVRVRALIAAGVTALLMAGIFWSGWHAFREYALLLNTVTPIIMIGVTFVCGSLLHHLMVEREQRWIRDAFSRYVSPNRVDFLVEHPDSMELGSRRRECSFIFTDLAGFTSLLESRDPDEISSLLNGYLDHMIGIAFRHDGTLDRIVGDAVAIMFSAPIVQADHRSRALACAMEMNAFAADYAASASARGVPFGKTRIGVHSGEVIVGNFGGSTIFDYRALGDPVNTASRLEGANKYFGTSICISEVTLAGVADTVARPIGRITLKGKARDLLVYEPLPVSPVPTYAPLNEYEAAYRLMADEAPGAQAMFDDLMMRFPQDPLVALHHRRLAEGHLGALIVMIQK